MCIQFCHDLNLASQPAAFFSPSEACSMQMSPFLKPPRKFNAASIVVVMTLSLTATFLTFQCNVWRHAIKSPYTVFLKFWYNPTCSVCWFWVLSHMQRVKTIWMQINFPAALTFSFLRWARLMISVIVSLKHVRTAWFPVRMSDEKKQSAGSCESNADSLSWQ